MRERVQRALPHLLARARSTSSGVTATLRGGDGRVERGLAELGLDARLVGLEQPRADVLAQLVEVVEAGVDREVVVELGQLLALDLLDGHVERGVAAGELARRGSRRGRSASTVRCSPALAPTQRLLEARDQVAAAELDQLVAALAALERLQALAVVVADAQRAA